MQILSKGWGLVTSKNLISLGNKKIICYRETEKKARGHAFGIFKKPFEILSFIYSKDNLVGVVQEVIEGYIYKVKTKSGEIMKIELSMVYTPIAHEIGAF